MGHKVQKEKLFHIAWRPHPPSLLSQQKQQDIKKNLKQYSRKYDAMDEQAKESARQAFRLTGNRGRMRSSRFWTVLLTTKMPARRRMAGRKQSTAKRADNKTIGSRWRALLRKS